MLDRLAIVKVIEGLETDGTNCGNIVSSTNWRMKMDICKECKGTNGGHYSYCSRYGGSANKMKTLKELYLEAARVAGLEEQYPGIYPIKFRGRLYSSASLTLGIIKWMHHIDEIEFALAIVENKPCFRGDELWSLPNNFKFIADHTNDIGIWNKSLNGLSNGARFTECSWNPPKPRTVMVEMELTDVQYIANTGAISIPCFNACRKALEELK